ncbi:FUSC family protein [Acetobacteraceae bacterium EV16G]|uniref:FUSC family protein n=1 Tax=Sorlinia euscelidii TaxID=3081148 RepID=A0ABU7U4K9_9PROT
MNLSAILGARVDGEAPWRQMVRMLVSVIACWVVGYFTELEESVWALITSLIVTQSTISQTITTARDQIVGTIIGALFGTAAVTLRLFYGHYWLVFAASLTPIAFIASVRPSLRFAGVTLMIIYLMPSHGNPYWPLTQRLASIFLGVVVSIIVSYLVLHASARRRAFTTASRMFRALDALLQAALAHRQDWAGLEAMNDQAAKLQLVLNECLEEANRENLGMLERRHPILSVLPALMRRMQSDTMLVARAINIGKGRSGMNDMRGELRHGLSHAYRALARRCELLSAGKGGEMPERPRRNEVLSHLPLLGPDALPEMHFVFSFLREDLRQAADILMSSSDKTADDLRRLMQR